MEEGWRQVLMALISWATHGRLPYSSACPHRAAPAPAARNPSSKRTSSALERAPPSNDIWSIGSAGVGKSIVSGGGTPRSNSPVLMSMLLTAISVWAPQVWQRAVCHAQLLGSIDRVKTCPKAPVSATGHLAGVWAARRQNSGVSGGASPVDWRAFFGAELSCHEPLLGWRPRHVRTSVGADEKQSLHPRASCTWCEVAGPTQGCQYSATPWSLVKLSLILSSPMGTSSCRACPETLVTISLSEYKLGMQWPS